MATYNFRLTATGVAELKTQLEALGPAGAAAFARIEAGARQSSAQTTQATNSFSGLGRTIGQAGFQLQDFAVQVQSGTSALTALAQQGSQFLGVFGTGGAIAGAVLAVGALAAQFLSTAESTDKLTAAQKELKSALEDLSSLGDTTAEAQQRRIEKNKEEADSVYTLAKAKLTEREDALVRRREQQQEIIRSLEADVRAGLKDAPDLLADQQGIAQWYDNRIAEVRSRLGTIEDDFSRTLTVAGRDALEETLKWARDVAKGASDEFSKELLGFRQKYEREQLDALIRRVTDEDEKRRGVELQALARQQQLDERRVAEAERQWNRMFDRTTDFAADALFGAFTGRIEDIGALLRTTLLRAVAQGIAEVGIRPLLMQGASALGLSAGGGGGVSIGGFGFGGGGIQSALFGGSVVDPWGGLDVTSGLLGEGGTLFGSTSLAEGFLPFAGSLLPGLLSGNVRQAAFGGGGAAIGGAIGSVIPGIGTAIGAGVGGTLGNLLGGMFGGGGRGNPYTNTGVNVGPDGRLYGWSQGDNGADTSGDLARANQIAAQVNALASTYGLTIGSGSGAWGARAGSESDALQSVVRGLSAAPGTRSAGVLGRGITDLSTLTTALGFDKALADGIARLTDPAAFALKQFEETAKARLEQAKSLGADLVEVERLNALERAEVLRQSGADVLDWLREQALGPTSSLSVADRSRVAEEAFAAAARGSDIGALTTAADTLLSTSGDLFGRATSAYAEREAFVRLTVANRAQSLGTGGSELSALVAVISAKLDEVTAAVDRGNGIAARDSLRSLVA